MVDVGNSKRLGKQIYGEFSEKNVTFMAASIAYYAFLSLVPVLLFLLLIVSLVGGGLEEQLLSVAQEHLPGPIADVFVTVFEGAGGSPSASIIGLAVLAWGALRIFRGLDTAFSEIYETAEESTFVGTMLDGAVVFLAIAIAVLATVSVVLLVRAFTGVVPFIGVLTAAVLVLGLIVAFLPMYHRFPDTEVGWREILPGAVFAAVGWAIFQSLFQVYLSVAGGGSENIFGGVIVVVTWLYFSGVVLLLGAVINAVLGDHTTSRGGIGAEEPEETAELSRTEFVRYLARLRSDVARRDGEIRSEDPRYPRASDDVQLVERASDDGEFWEVTFRWEERSEAAEDEEPAEPLRE